MIQNHESKYLDSVLKQSAEKQVRKRFEELEAPKHSLVVKVEEIANKPVFVESDGRYREYYIL